MIQTDLDGGGAQIAWALEHECRGLKIGDSKTCEITPTPAFERYKAVQTALTDLDPGLVVEWKCYNYQLTITIHREA